MTANIQSPHVLMLCTLAEGDESALQYPLPSPLYGFHAQQSCEKLMKALISAHGRDYPMTHNHEKLMDQLDSLNEKLPMVPYDLLDLEPFAVQLRYDFGTELSDMERVAIRETVVTLREHVIARILELERTAIV